MKKILFAITGLGGGGAERVVSVWSSQLIQRGYDVGILTFARKKGEYVVDPRVKRLVVSENIEDYLRMSYVKRFRLMRKLVKEFSPNVVISFLTRMQIWMAAVMIGIRAKRIDTVRNSPWHWYEGAITKQLWKLCFKTGDLTILQSEDQKPYFSRGIQKKCVVVPNPLNEAYEREGKTAFPNKVTRFVAAGRLAKQKNYSLMIKAFAKTCEFNNEITLDIYGKGSDEQKIEIQGLINDLGMADRICLRGRTDDMHGTFVKYDAFVMSSDFEGMPNALAEAMAVGLVCISTDCKTGPRDLVKDGENGFLVPVGDVDAMAEKIKAVANMNAEEIEHFGREARHHVTTLCGRENSLEKLIEAIEK